MIGIAITNYLRQRLDRKSCTVAAVDVYLDVLQAATPCAVKGSTNGVLLLKH
jgi:hypothetical protein